MSCAHPVQAAPSGGADFLRWIGTKNPFYAISAALVLWGLWVSFGNKTEEVETWLLMSGLAGYTLLLAATAVVLVRYLKLWEDARTVLLLVVLLFLATSVTFDHLLVVEPERGNVCYLLGLGLAVLITEAVLRGIQLRLPALYRLPYYLLLSLFFLYPIFVRQLLEPSEPLHEPGLWGLFGFSTAAGLAFLTLLPALRRGADYVRENGSPLPWPLYPWSLFVVFAIAVPGRAVFMCWSLHWLESTQYDRLVFGPYFLVPFGFALAVLFLETGRVLTRSAMLRFSLVVPLLLIGLAMVGHRPSDPVYRALRVLTVPMGWYKSFDTVRSLPDPVYGEFLKIFSERLGGDPLFLTLVLAIGFYAYASLRRVPLASEALSGTLAALAIVGTDSLRTGWLVPPRATALLAPAALQLGLGIWRRNPWCQLFGAGCLAGFIALAAPFPEPVASGLRSGLFVHLIVLALLAVGALFGDAAGLAVRRLGAFSMLALSLAVMWEWVRVPENILPEAPVVYPLLMGILLVFYGQLLRHSFSLVIATVILGYWVFSYGWTAYRVVRRMYLGLDYIVPGLAFFVVAVLVSLAKSGVLIRWIESRWRVPLWLQPTLGLQPFPQAPAVNIPASPAPGSDSIPEQTDGT